MVSRNSKIPLYHQLYEVLRKHIDDGDWQPGDMLPTESDLLEEYDVSRNTVRQALDALVNEGLIVRQRGRGTFVAQPTIEQALSRIISFTEDMQVRDLEPGTEVLNREIVPAADNIAGALDVPTGEALAHLERLRLADGEPMSIEFSYLVHKYCPGVLDENYAQVPLRQTLERRYGLRLTTAKQTIRAINAPGDLAKKLGVKRGAALLYIERTTFSHAGIPVEFLRVYHRGDRYTLYNELRDERI